MTTQEAIKSGKRFRRKLDRSAYWWMANCPHMNVSKEDILATDWEVEEQKITVTKDDVAKAYAEAEKECCGGIKYYTGSRPIIYSSVKLQTLFDKLGFK